MHTRLVGVAFDRKVVIYFGKRVSVVTFKHLCLDGLYYNINEVNSTTSDIGPETLYLESGDFIRCG